MGSDHWRTFVAIRLLGDAGSLTDEFSQVIQLQNTLEQALGAVLSLRNEFSPINRLPTESLIHIFDLICAPGRDESHSHARHATTLAQVCSHWRSNTISTPLLWSTIHISRKIRPQLIALSLERSKDVPLEIILEIRGGLLAFPGLPTYPRSTTSLFVSGWLSLMTPISTMVQSVELLIANSDRVRRFSFKFEHEFSNGQNQWAAQDRGEEIPSKEIFERFLPSGLVSLEWEAGVNITAISRGSVVRLPEPFMEKSLSNLQSLSLRNTFTGPVSGVKNLRSFHLAYTGGIVSDVTPWRLHEFLSRNLTLEHIVLEGYLPIPGPEQEVPKDPVVLNHLTALKLDRVDVPPFLRVASMPSLGKITSVYLDTLASVMKVSSSNGLVDINTSPSVWDTIRTFMEVEIDSFHIQGDAPTPFGFCQQPWRALLHKVPTFRTLQIAGNVQGYKEALVLSFSFEPDQFPNLETLRLDPNSNASSASFNAIAEIAESRAKRSKHLTKVEYLGVGGSATKKWKELYGQHRIQDHLLCESKP